MNAQFWRTFSRWSAAGTLLSLALIVVGCRTTRGADVELTRARFALESMDQSGYGMAVTLPISGVRISLEADAIVSEFDYESIEMAQMELGKCLVFRLKPPAARDFFRATVGSHGKRLVLLVNGQAVGARRLEGPISDGRIQIFLEATDEDLAVLAKKLQVTNIEIQKKLSR